MNRYNVGRSLLLAGLASLPAGAALGAAAHDAAHHPSAARPKKYKGPVVTMRWGTVQAIVTVKGRKITSVKIAVAPENFRSQFIDQQALPVLKQETLRSQSALIDIVSGATMTSDAYIQSLEAALHAAHL